MDRQAFAIWHRNILLTLNLPHRMIAGVNVSPGAVYLANAFGESETSLDFSALPLVPSGRGPVNFPWSHPRRFTSLHSGASLRSITRTLIWVDGSIRADGPIGSSIGRYKT
jgi:hypothetical protein